MVCWYDGTTFGCSKREGEGSSCSCCAAESRFLSCHILRAATEWPLSPPVDELWHACISAGNRLVDRHLLQVLLYDIEMAYKTPRHPLVGPFRKPKELRCLCCPCEHVMLQSHMSFGLGCRLLDPSRDRLAQCIRVHESRGTIACEIECGRSQVCNLRSLGAIHVFLEASDQIADWVGPCNMAASKT